MAKNTSKPTSAAAAPTERAGWSPSRLCLLLAAVVAMVYGNTLKNGFAVDDNVMLVGNKLVAGGVSAIPTLLVTPHQRGYWVTDHDEYRPLSLMLFAAEYQVWELWPAGYHFMNILLFACCVSLLFLFLRELLARGHIGVAFIAALLFALHPIHTEVVANVKSSDELLSFALAFGGMLLGARYMRSGKTNLLIAAGLCFLLAHLAKESVVTLVVIVPVVFFFFINGHRGRAIRLSIAFALAAVVFIVARYAVLSYWHADSATAGVTMLENALRAPGLSAASRLATAILMMGMYLKLALIPWPLIDDYSFNTIPVTGFGNPLVWLTIAVYAALCVVATRRFLKDRRDPYAFSILFFLVTIALFSNIFITIKATFGERFLFYPSVGVCLAIAALLCRWVGDAGIRALSKTKALAVLAPLCLLWGGATMARNPEWMDNGTLYGADVVKAPENVHLNYFYGYDLFARFKQPGDPAERRGQLEEAIKYFRKALDIYPAYDFALTDMAAAFFCAGRYDSAIVYGKRAVAAAPNYDLPRNNLSAAYLNARRYEEDVAFNKETIRLMPGDADAYVGIGFSYKCLGVTDSAIRYVRMGMNVEPRHIPLYQIMADIYYAAGNADSSGYYRRVAGAMGGR